MASGPPGGGGESTAAATTSTAVSEKPRWPSERKVYTRKFPAKNPKPPPNSNPNPNPPSQILIPTPPPPPPEAAPPEAAPPEPEPAADEPAETAPRETEPAADEPAETAPRETAPPADEPAETAPPADEPAETAPPADEPAETAPLETAPPETEPAADEPAETEPASSPRPPPRDAAPPLPVAVASDDASSSLNRDGGGGGAVPNGHGNGGSGGETSRKRQERRELRRRLAAELEQVRALSKRLEATSAAMAAAASVPQPRPPQDISYGRSQFSGTDPEKAIRTPVAAVVPARSLLHRRPLTVAVIPSESLEKEKRTPKANQYYHNSEFLLAKDKFPPADSHGHKKSKHHKKHHSLAADCTAERRLFSHAFKKCMSLLSRLMKHRFGWVFNKPVDPVALGLHDYFLIIKHPMDLGTIKGQLNRGQYRNPREFADDVRLTFRNAMTYNPKGQDVHFMAEQLLEIFEAQWPEIEAEVEYLESCPPLPKKFPPPPIDLRVLERSDSTLRHMALDSKSRPVSHTPPYSARTPSLKKPKAKDPHKRDMTHDEKRKLSNNLQNLPPEKLQIVVQIIQNKNLSVRQREDEIEIDIDSVDVETLWELDRFVTNYKKNLSKHRRKAELAMLARQEELRARNAAQERSQELNIGETPKRNVVAEKQLALIPTQDGKNGENVSGSSSSGSSTSDSGSSSSDSDSDSSSGDGSDAANSS